MKIISDFNYNINTEYKLKDDLETDDAYRECLLNFLNLKDYKDKDVNNKLSILYNLTKNINIFKEKYIKGAEKFLSDDPEVGVMVMLSYDELDFFISLFKQQFQ